MKKYLPVFLLVLAVASLYWQLFLKGKIPFPADLMVGAYFPWLDYKWGNIVGVAIKNPGISDVFSLLAPWKYLVLDNYRSLVLPLWNPYILSGTPLMANYQSSAFFLPNLILALPKYFGWGLYVFLQTLVAATGMYFLLGKLIKNEASKVLGAIVFVFSGLMTTWVEFGMAVWAMAFLPWFFYFLKSYIEGKKRRFFVLAVFSLVLLIFAGHAQITLYALALCACYLLYLSFSKQISYQRLFEAILILIIALGISAVQIIPTITQAGLSVRGTENYLSNFIYHYGLTPVFDYIRLFAADFFGNPVTRNFIMSDSYFENSFFLGTLSLPLILPLFFQRFREKETGFWLIVFILSLFLGLDFPLTQFLYSKDVLLLTYSSASRIFFLTSLSGGILTAYGLNKLSDKRFEKWVVRFILTFFLILIFTILYLRLGGTSEANFLVSLRNSVLPFALLIIGFVILMVRLPVRVVTYLFVLLIFVDLARYFLKFNTFSDQRLIYPETPVIDFLRSQPGIFRIARLDRRVMPPNTWIPYGLSSVEGNDALASLGYLRLFNKVNSGKLTDGVSRYAEIYTPDYKYLDLLNVKYLLSVDESSRGNPEKAIPKTLKKVFAERSVIVYENMDVLPRTYFVPSVVNIGENGNLAGVMDKEGFDPRKVAVIGTDDSVSGPFGTGEASIKSYGSGYLSIDTKSDLGGFLVVSDGFDRGWRAKIDRKSSKVYEVDGALRGISVPSGVHEITLEYWPNPVCLGLYISLVSLLITILWSVLRKP